MKSLKIYITSFFITFLCLGTVNAQTQGLGKRLAQDVIAYVSYIELGNIGSKDADCKGNCTLARDLFQKQDGVKVNFWCDKDRYIS